MASTGPGFKVFKNLLGNILSPNGNSIGNLKGTVQFMDNNDDAHAHGIAQFQNQIIELGRHNRIETGAGLVAKQDFVTKLFERIEVAHRIKNMLEERLMYNRRAGKGNR